MMKALGLETTAFDKYDPNQPRVPASSGRASGQWGDGGSGVAWATPVPSRSQNREPARRPPIIPVVDDGPLIPRGEVVIPHDGMIDPLDPANLNTPLSAAEQLSIAETLTMIRAERAADTRS